MRERPGACPDANELSDFHEGRLTEPVAALVGAHLEACAPCAAELAELALDDRLAAELRRLLPGGPTDLESVPDGDGEAEVDAFEALLRANVGAARYEVLGELGHGGMGVVHEVRDHVLRRDLAMKVVRVGGGSTSNRASPAGRRLARFLEEARITGQLDHPSIPPVHELGLDAEGRAYFTMTRVRGLDLHDVFEELDRGEGDWTLQGLVGVLQRACDAVAFAHSKGVVHRDLKPANIMVGRFGAVYVMDWGVARVVAGGEADPRTSDVAGPDVAAEPASPHLTLEGEILGTPAYMAPEQASGRMDDVGFPADVYSMGAILYRLLSGGRPYAEGVDPGTPRAAWKRLLEGPPPPLSEVAPRAPRELVAVCDRAMARDPAARYREMEGLASDLRAWLEGRVVRAHRTGVVVEVRKWVGRNRALATAALLVVVALSGLLLRHSAVEARSRDDVSRAAASLAAQRMLDVDPAGALRLALQVAKAEPTYANRTMVLAALEPLVQDAFLRTDVPVLVSPWALEGTRRAWSPDSSRIVFGGPEVRGEPARIRVWDVKRRRFEETSFGGPATEVFAFHPGGVLIASGGADGSVALHDRSTGRSRRLVGPDGIAHRKLVSRLAFDPDGGLLASASWDGSVKLWNVATGALERELLGHEGVVMSIEFDATGERIVSASGQPNAGQESDGTARVWRVSDGHGLHVFRGHDPQQAVTSARFHPTEDLVLSTSYDGSAQLWTPSDGAVVLRLELGSPVFDGAFSPDGSTLAAAHLGGFLVRELESGYKSTFGQYEAHDGRIVWDVEFAPDGKRLLTTGGDGAGRIWDLEAGARPRGALRLPGRALMTLGSWSPDGASVVTANVGGLRLWFPDEEPTTDRARPVREPATHARFHPAGDRVLVTFEASPAFEYAFTPGEGLASEPTRLGAAPAADVATSGDGAWTLVAERGGPIRLWCRGEDGASREAGALDLDAEALHAAPGGGHVGAILAGGGAVVLDGAGRPRELVRLAEDDVVRAIRFSEDGRRAALGTKSGRLLVVDLAADGAPILDLDLDPESVSEMGVLDVCLFDAGRRLLSAGPLAGIRLWDVDAGREVVQNFGRLATIGGLFAMRGEALCVAQWSPHIHVGGHGPGAGPWRSLQPATAAHLNRICDWSLDRGRRRLLTTSLDRTARVWDLERFEPWVTFAGHDACVLAGDLSGDGEWAVTADAGGTVCVWPTDPLAWEEHALPVEVGPRR